jgi:uncharacterized protein YndB with AHSA1/START domain
LIEPVFMTAVVPIDPQQAFDLFTHDFGSWWPVKTHSIGQSHAVTAVIEPFAGGAVYERLDDDTRHAWGNVLVWEPPNRVVLSWHPGHEPSRAQQVEVRFTAADAGTRVELRHYGWEVLGDQAQEVRSGYAHGWVTVFGESFVDAANRAAAVRA